MTYYYYLKKQLYIFTAAALSCGVTYFVALYFCWRDPITISIPYIVSFAVLFIFVGAILRFKIEK